MKKFFLLLTIYAGVVTGLYAQRVIAVETASVTTLYSTVDSAVAHASDGSNIHLPGGAFTINDLLISKKVNIYGVGHYNDSTSATGITQLNGNLFFVSGSDGATIQGIYLSGNINFGTNSGNQVANSVIIKRCSMGNLNLSFDGSTSTGSQFILIRENVIRGAISGGNAQNISIENNLINGQVYYFNGNVLFSNNLFFYTYSYASLLNNTSACTFESNVFLSQNIFNGSSTSNTLTKNIFTTSDQTGGSNISNGNQFNVSQSSLFVNQSGNSFNYSHDYHLANSSPATGTGVNSTDIGVYGGNNPYKEGAVPFNPQVQQKTISPNTDSNGNINVNIKVQAQTK